MNQDPILHSLQVPWHVKDAHRPQNMTLARKGCTVTKTWTSRLYFHTCLYMAHNFVQLLIGVAHLKTVPQSMVFYVK